MPSIEKKGAAHVAKVRIHGAPEYKRSFRCEADARAWAAELERCVRAGLAPNASEPKFLDVLSDFARKNARRWRDPQDAAAIADVKRRFGRYPVATIAAADVTAWWREMREAMPDALPDFERRLSILSAALTHARTRMHLTLPLGHAVAAFRRSRAEAVGPAHDAPADVEVVEVDPAPPLPAQSPGVVEMEPSDEDVFLRSGLAALLGARAAPSAPAALDASAVRAMLDAGFARLREDVAALVRAEVLARGDADDALWRERDAARWLGVSASLLRRDRRTGCAGNVPFLRIGRMVRYDPRAVRSWVSRRTAADGNPGSQAVAPLR